MKRITLAALIAPSIILASCATTPSPAEQAKRAEFEKTIPVCVDEKDCKVKWETAQLWIVRNSAYKLQIVTDVLLQTYNPTGGTPQIGVQATKEPAGGGRYKILVRVFCDNIFGCVPNPWDAVLDFNKTVGAAAP